MFIHCEQERDEVRDHKRVVPKGIGFVRAMAGGKGRKQIFGVART